MPFVFFTTSAQERVVVDAYALSVQGLFLKPNSMEALRDTVKAIVDYWVRCYTPNVFSNGQGRQIFMETTREKFG